MYLFLKYMIHETILIIKIRKYLFKIKLVWIFNIENNKLIYLHLYNKKWKDKIIQQI